MKSKKHFQHENTHTYTDEKGTRKHCFDCRGRIYTGNERKERNWRLFANAFYISVTLGLLTYLIFG